MNCRRLARLSSAPRMASTSLRHRHVMVAMFLTRRGSAVARPVPTRPRVLVGQQDAQVAKIIPGGSGDNGIAQRVEKRIGIEA